MKFWQKARFAALCLLALALSGQTVTTGDPTHVRLRAIGEKLKCQCSCSYTVGSCNMLNCHFREEINEQLQADMSAGISEPAMLAKLKEKYGTHILAAPPAEGFNLVGWIMPFVALVVGLIVIRFVLARWRKPRPAPALSSVAVDKFRDQMEKELADLE